MKNYLSINNNVIFIKIAFNTYNDKIYGYNSKF